jgi:protein-ribulosamine 3-kinase
VAGQVAEIEKIIIGQCTEKLKEIYGPSVQINNSTSVGGGCINQAVRINSSVGDFFLKWNNNSHPDLFLKEAAGLHEMAASENPYLIIPKVIWTKEADEWPGLLMLEYLEPARGTSGFDELLGRGIAFLHRKTASQYGFKHSNYCGITVQDNEWTTNWPEFYAQKRIWALVQQIKDKRGMAVEEMAVYDKLVSAMPGLLAHETVPSLIHGDLWSGNYMFTAKGPALIDPACYYADREMELGMMDLFGGFSEKVWRAYQEEFPLSEGWKERLRLYQLYHVLNHYLLFGGSYGRQALEIAKRYPG